jgi:murein DD-endopeptidase MepM/ murein hydrolase activator NlpD
MLRSRPFEQNFALGTGWRYSDGDLHAAHDYPMPIGTPLFAIADGTIGAQHDGEDPDSPGNNYSGEPSNWVLLWTTHKGNRVTVYYQHLARTTVKNGQKVKAGDIIGYSGNSGNSTGAHLHIHAMKGWTLDRYKNMVQVGGNYPYVIYPPSQLWRGAELPLSNSDINKIAKAVWEFKIDADPESTAKRPVKRPAQWLLGKVFTATKK